MPCLSFHNFPGETPKAPEPRWARNGCGGLELGDTAGAGAEVGQERLAGLKLSSHPLVRMYNEKNIDYAL